MREDGTYCFFGTPIEIDEEDEPLKKRVAAHDQIVTDKQGRRRFHGAFTGGFSAGYYNTVGTAEGWAPSSFTSSRQRQQEQPGRHAAAPSGSGRAPAQSITDFMDEEDMEDFGIAPKQVRTTGAFADPAADAGPRSKRSKLLTHDSKAMAYLQNLIQPTKENIGAKMLKGMGWREGQGIGPRIPARRRTPGHSEAADPRIFDDIAAARGVSLAPRDTRTTSFDAKDNFFGIGYRGMTAADLHLDTKRRGMGGIGVGALEEADDDIYEDEAAERSQYDRIMGGEAPDLRHHPAQQRLSGPAQLALKGPIDDFSGPSRFALSGFVAPSNPLNTKTVYPGHRPPKDWSPFHKFDVPGPFSNGSLSRPAQHAMNHLSARQRAQLLGEQLDAPRPNIFEAFQPSALAADRVGTAVEQQEPPTSRSHDPLTSKHALSEMQQNAFRPFRTDAEKQRRYEAYMRGHPVRARHHSAIDHDNELREFQQAKRLYKPLSRVMALRFQPATKNTEPGSAREELAEREAEESQQQSDRQTAAKMKMFGKLTRREVEWHPHRLLCRRFNLADPYPKSGIVGVVAEDQDRGNRRKSRWDDVGRLDADTLVAAGLTAAASAEQTRQAQADVRQDQTAQQAQMREAPPQPARAAALSSTAEREAIEHEAQAELERLPPRPAVDLFAAVFDASSDEDEDDDEDTVTEAKGNELEQPQVESQAQVQAPAAAQPSAQQAASGGGGQGLEVTAIAPSTSSAPSKLGHGSPNLGITPPPTAPEARADPDASKPVYVKASQRRAAQEAPRLTLQSHHPLATGLAVPVVRATSDKLEISLQHLGTHDEDDWVEAPREDLLHKLKKSKDKRERKSKKSKKHKDDDRSHRHRHERHKSGKSSRRRAASTNHESSESEDEATSRAQDRLLLEKLRNAGGVAALQGRRSPHSESAPARPPVPKETSAPSSTAQQARPRPRAVDFM